MPKTVSISFIILVSTKLYASATLIVDPLDSPSEGTLPPPQIAVVDVLVDVSPDDAWNFGNFRGLAVNGARLRYAHDAGGPVLISPGDSDRFVTLLSQPLERDADERFTDGGARTNGSYNPPGPDFVANPTELNVAWYSWPLATPGSDSVDGAILRVALDLPVPGVPLAVRRFDEVQPGDTPLFLSYCDGTPIGTGVATVDVPAFIGLDWALVQPVPEPSTCALLIAVMTATRRRR
jgi:hypothetical protein